MIKPCTRCGLNTKNPKRICTACQIIASPLGHNFEAFGAIRRKQERFRNSGLYYEMMNEVIDKTLAVKS